MSGGVGRLARRLLAQAEALEVPALPDPDVEPLGRVALAEHAGITLDPWQGDAAKSPARKLLWLASRQAGKSTVAALLAVHEAAFNAGALVLMLAPSLRQSGELFRTTVQLYKRTDAALPAITMESALRLELENGARIVALPGGSESTVRGYSAASLVIIDEAARVPDALIAAIRPVLAVTNGRLVALSTPAGKRGWFYLEWSSGEGWERSRVVASECPRISKEFLADELRSLGPRVYAQEYECEFFDPDTAVFSSELIQRALTKFEKPFWGVA